MVIRTYGDDLDKIVAAINAYGEGKYIDGCVDFFKCELENVYKGRYN